MGEDTNNYYVSAFTWLVFFGLSATAIGFTYKYGCSVPFGDDWVEVPELAQKIPSDLNWYFASANTHRRPFMKLGLAVMWNLTHDVRLGLLFNVCSYIIITAIATNYAVKFGGRPEYSDAVVPLVMLNLGHAWNYLWWVQSFFLWAGCFSSVLIASFFYSEVYQKSANRVFLSLALIFLSWQGAIGAIMAPVLAIGYFLRMRREVVGQHLAFPVVIVGLALISTGFLAYDFSNRENGDHTSLNIMNQVDGIAGFISVSIGPLGSRLPLLFSATIIAATIFAFFNTQKWNDKTAIFIGFSTVIAVAVCIAIGRSGGEALRYACFSCPILVVTYLGLKSNLSSSLGEFLRMGLLLILAAVTLYNTSHAIEMGKSRKEMETVFLDSFSEIPLKGIAGLYGQYWSYSQEGLRTGIERLRESGVAPYDRLKDFPQYQSQSLESPDMPVKKLDWAFESPQQVLAIDLDYTMESNRGISTIQISWDRGSSFSARERIGKKEVYVKPHTGIRRKSHLIWIDASLKDIHIEVQNPDETLLIHSAILLTESP